MSTALLGRASSAPVHRLALVALGLVGIAGVPRSASAQAQASPQLAAAPAALDASRPPAPSVPPGAGTDALMASPGPDDAAAQVSAVAPVPGTEPQAAPGAVRELAATTPAARVAQHGGVFGSTLWGGLGIHRLASGFPTERRALVLSLSTAYSRVPNLFLPGDRNTRSAQEVDLAYAPVRGLEISASYHAVANSYSGRATRTLEAQGSPTLRVKYGHALPARLALGVQLAATLPTSALGRGLTPAAGMGEALALVSWQPHPRIEVVGNFGYLLDRSNRLFEDGSADVLQRFAYQLNRTSQLPYGVGAQGRLTLGRAVDLLPFVEVTGGLGLGAGATLENDPFRLSTGLKLYPSAAPVVELVLGCDVAMGGRPQLGSPFGGQPDWEFFAHLHAHLGRLMHRAPAEAPGSAAAPGPGLAAIVTAPTGDMQTFTLAGTILDDRTGAPILGSYLMVGEQREVLLAASEQTGQFSSWPIAAGPGLVRVTAHAAGYADVQRMLVRPQPGERVALAFKLHAESDRTQPSPVQGAVHDAVSGAAIAGAEIEVPGQRAQARADATGHFSLKLAPGRHLMRLRAPGYALLERSIVVRPGEVLVFNGEMHALDEAP